MTSVLGSGAGLESMLTSAGTSARSPSARRQESTITNEGPRPASRARPGPSSRRFSSISSPQPCQGSNSIAAGASVGVRLADEEERPGDDDGIAGSGALRVRVAPRRADRARRAPARSHPSRRRCRRDRARAGPTRVTITSLGVRQERLEHRGPRLVRHDGEHHHQPALADEVAEARPPGRPPRPGCAHRRRAPAAPARMTASRPGHWTPARPARTAVALARERARRAGRGAGAPPPHCGAGTRRRGRAPGRRGRRRRPRRGTRAAVGFLEPAVTSCPHHGATRRPPRARR